MWARNLVLIQSLYLTFAGVFGTDLGIDNVVWSKNWFKMQVIPHQAVLGLQFQMRDCSNTMHCSQNMMIE